MRHIWACSRRWSTCAVDRWVPGDSDRTMSRPERSIARAHASIASGWYGASMSSTLRKSTPQPASCATSPSRYACAAGWSWSRP